jgi:protein phosphatase
MRLRATAATDVGRVRGNNEDSFASLPERGLFIICDGMGGTAAGEVASRLAVDTIVAQLNGTPRREEESPVEGAAGYLPQTTRLAAAIRRSNQSIFDQASQNAAQAEMGTTVVVVWVTHNVASVAHVGDSRAYVWHRDRLEAITSDHSLVEARVQAGLLTREESLKAADQNILLRAVGREPNVEIDLHEVPLQAGDFVVLCSDGLTRMVPEDAIASAIARFRNPDEICRHLIDKANSNGGVDNITVIVVEVEGDWWHRVMNRLERRNGGGVNGPAGSAV